MKYILILILTALCGGAILARAINPSIDEYVSLSSLLAVPVAVCVVAIFFFFKRR